MPIDQSEFDALDPRNAPREDRRYIADQTAADIEAACFDVVCGSSSREQAADALDIKDGERAAFYRELNEVRATYEQVGDLLENQGEVLLATHVPPFNTSFDRHHAVGTREEDREHLHVGSIALKLAIREHNVFATLSGHSHTHGYDIGDGRDGRPHCLNFGYRGMGTISVIPDEGQFAYAQILEDQ
jgi:hypothetical protein